MRILIVANDELNQKVAASQFNNAEIVADYDAARTALLEHRFNVLLGTPLLTELGEKSLLSLAIQQGVQKIGIIGDDTVDIGLGAIAKTHGLSRETEFEVPAYSNEQCLVMYMQAQCYVDRESLEKIPYEKARGISSMSYPVAVAPIPYVTATDWAQVFQELIIGT